MLRSRGPAQSGRALGTSASRWDLQISGQQLAVQQDRPAAPEAAIGARLAHLGPAVLAKKLIPESSSAQLLRPSVLGLLCCTLACVSIPARRYALDSISVHGNHSV